MFGNEIPDQVGDDVMARSGMTSRTFKPYHHDQMKYNIMTG